MAMIKPKASVTDKKGPWVIFLIVITLVFAGCAKQRHDKQSDDLEDNTLRISEVQGAKITITTGDQPDLLKSVSGKDYLAVNRSTRYPVVKVTSSLDQLKPLFKDLDILGQPNTAYDVKIEIKGRNLMAYIVLSNEKAKEFKEKSLVFTNGLVVGNKQEIFSYEIDSFGVVERVKNDLDEDTRDLKYEKLSCNTLSDCANASHIHLGMYVSERKDAGIYGLDTTKYEYIFDKSKINGNVFSLEELDKNFSIEINDGSAKAGDQFETEITRDKLKLMKIVKFEYLNSVQKRMLTQGKESEIVRKCSEQLVEKIDEDCYLVYAYSVEISHKKLKKAPIKPDGTFDPIPEIKAETALKSRLIEITVDAKIISEEEKGRFEIDAFEKFYRVKVKDLKGKEFLLRRTITDAANKFQYVTAGDTSPLWIVKFEFEDNRVVVKRADILTKTIGHNDIDSEEIMAFNVDYNKLVNKDPRGNRYDKTRAISTTKDDPDAIAVFSLDSNQIFTRGIPLDYYGYASHCFDGKVASKVSDIDISRGNLNFTIDSTYMTANSKKRDCAEVLGWSGMEDYYTHKQFSFKFKERVSFKEYKKYDEEEPQFDVSYHTQRKLNFGLFIQRKDTPDENGQTWMEGGKTNLPQMYDFRNGRTFIYVLAGLPTLEKESDLRRRMIESTVRVIENLNETFGKAFKGSELERRGPYVFLKVERDEEMPKNALEYYGVEISPKKQLGDLDVNYIYNVQKQTASGTIGLGGAHTNPRSGKVEAASVFMYGGNIKNYAIWRKKYAEWSKTYADNVTPKLEEKGVTEVNMVKILEDQMNNYNIQERQEEQSVQEAEKIVIPTFMLSTDYQLNNATFSLARPKEMAIKLADVSTLDTNMLKRIATLGVSNPKIFTDREIAPLSDKKISSKDVKFYQKIQEMIRINSMSKEELMESGLTRILGDRNAIAAHFGDKQAKVWAQIDKAYNARNFCRQTFEPFSPWNMEDIEKLSNDDIFIRNWESSLTHEIGHNFGLRHNFYGSVDKKNWKHDAHEETKRTYSSVMDYSIDDIYGFSGYGPYDMHAFRAAYTGLVELDDKELSKVVKVSTPEKDTHEKYVLSGTEVPIVGGKYIKIKDYPQAIHEKSWQNIGSTEMQRLKLKGYMYCSDEDVGYTPMCNRHDWGTTPQEVVDFRIRQYLTQYSFRNFPSQRLKFNSDRLGYYIGTIFSSFLNIRQFLEEAFYQAIYVKPEKEVLNDYLYAALNGYYFFQGVITNPDLPEAETNNPENRFVTVKMEVKKTDAQGEDILGPDGNPLTEKKPFVIERKALDNYKYSEDTDRIRVFGVEYDKIIATIILSMDSPGMPRYIDKSLQTPYPLFEKYILGMKPEESRLLKLFNSILQDNVAPTYYHLGKGMNPNLIPLSQTQSKTPFSVEVNKSMHVYAAQGVLISLDYDLFDPSDNPSRAFRVIGDRNLEAEYYMTEAEGDLKYTAAPNAFISQQMIEKGHQIRRMDETKIKGRISKWFEAFLKAFNSDPVKKIKKLKYNKADYAVMNERMLQIRQTIEVSLDATGGLAVSDDPAIQALIESRNKEIKEAKEVIYKMIRMCYGRLKLIKNGTLPKDTLEEAKDELLGMSEEYYDILEIYVEIEEFNMKHPDASVVAASKKNLQVLARDILDYLERELDVKIFDLTKSSTDKGIGLDAIKPFIVQTLYGLIQNPPKTPQEIKILKLRLESITKSVPIIEYFFKVIKGEKLGITALSSKKEDEDKSVKPKVIESLRYRIMDNIKRMHRYYYLMRPNEH